MATAIQDEDGFHLDLSMDEILTLVMVATKVGGSPDVSARKWMDDIMAALREVTGNRAISLAKASGKHRFTSTINQVPVVDQGIYFGPWST